MTAATLKSLKVKLFTDGADKAPSRPCRRAADASADDLARLIPEATPGNDHGHPDPKPADRVADHRRR
jgi:hypothetical protein